MRIFMPAVIAMSSVVAGRAHPRYSFVQRREKVRQALATLPSTSPLPARNSRDSVVSAALYLVAATHNYAVPDFGLLPDSERLIVSQSDGLVSAYSLPTIDSVMERSLFVSLLE